jgi:preprotein translocase subunit Sec61beta
MNILGIEISPEAVAFIGILVACILRTAIPYLYKHKDDGTIKFKLSYLVSFFLVVIVGMVAALLLLPAFSIPDSSFLSVFAAAFAYGWASDDIINKIITRLSG